MIVLSAPLQRCLLDTSQYSLKSLVVADELHPLHPSPIETAVGCLAAHTNIWIKYNYVKIGYIDSTWL